MFNTFLCVTLTLATFWPHNSCDTCHIVARDLCDTLPHMMPHCRHKIHAAYRIHVIFFLGGGGRGSFYCIAGLWFTSYLTHCGAKIHVTAVKLWALVDVTLARTTLWARESCNTCCVVGPWFMIFVTLWAQDSCDACHNHTVDPGVMWHMPQPHCRPAIHVTCHNHIVGPWVMWRMPQLHCGPVVYMTPRCGPMMYMALAMLWAHNSWYLSHYGPMIHAMLATTTLWACDSCDTCHNHVVGPLVTWHVTITFGAHDSYGTYHIVSPWFMLVTYGPMIHVTLASTTSWACDECDMTTMWGCESCDMSQWHCGPMFHVTLVMLLACSLY